MRRLFALVGLAAIVVGGVSLHHSQAVANACSSAELRLPTGRFGTSRSCMNTVSQEYLWFALIMIGAVVLGAALLMINRRRQWGKVTKKPSGPTPLDRWLPRPPSDRTTPRRSDVSGAPVAPPGRDSPGIESPGPGELHQKSA
ncbi:MAG: hypothetical protein KGJ36_08145 [Acidobacteriota bacterium]|nr:hypothetical protein [Acidobacteriota bacterium]